MKKQLLSIAVYLSSSCASQANTSGLAGPQSQPKSNEAQAMLTAVGGAPAAGASSVPAIPLPRAAETMAAPTAGVHAPTIAAPVVAGYKVLLSGTWTLEPGGESTRTCFKKTLTEDLFISKIRPINPPGTHHSLLSMGEDPASDCTESVAEGLIYAAAAGTEGLELPDGVAIKLPAGHTLKLGLHVFNATDKTLAGESGLEVVTLQPSEVKHESQAVLTGPAPFVLEPKATQKLKSTCTQTGQQTVFAVFPHMHEYGRHLSTTVVSGGATKVIHDSAFEFAEQRQYPLEPFTLNPNDTITTECTFENTTDTWVEFGESTTTEMCVSVLFAYPPVGTGLCLGLPE